MIQRAAGEDRGTLPPLGPALAAMTGLQALVALALFAPGVLAPPLGLDVGAISAFTTAVFAVGMTTSLAGGRLARRFGPCLVAMLCALAVAGAMGLATLATGTGLLLAGLCVGLAFGPETPASSTLLSVLARPAQRPLIFSIRQTGNQIGAMAGSLMLPLVALTSPRHGFLLIAAIAMAAALVFAAMRSRFDGVARGEGATLDLAAARAVVWNDPPLRALAFVSMPFSAMQLALNAYLVTFAVEALAFGHVAAGALLATAQAGGLIGRLLWGWVASRALGARMLLAMLGLGMAAAAIAMSRAGPHWPLAALTALAFGLGLTASGWNGVFLAEVARLSQPDRVAETTGTVLTASYAGLLSAPMLIAWASPTGKLQASFAAIAILALAATAVMMWSNREPAERV